MKQQQKKGKRHRGQSAREIAKRLKGNFTALSDDEDEAAAVPNYTKSSLHQIE